MENKEKNGVLPTVGVVDKKEISDKNGDAQYGSINNASDQKEKGKKHINEVTSWRKWCRIELLSNRLIVNIVPCAMDELPIRQSRSQPVNPSHVTINGLAHYYTHNASVDNSI